MPKIQTILDNLARRNEPQLRVALKKWLNDTQKQIKADLTKKYQKSADSVTSTLTDWELIAENGISTVKPAAMEVFKSGGNAAYKHLAILGSFDVVNIPAVKAVNKFCAKLVTDVTANTKKGIKTYIKHGIREGYSMPKIARELKPLVGLTGKQTQAVIHYRQLLQIRRPDLTAAQLDKATMRYTNKTHRMRMENIARTETANAQNIGYCQGLEQVGVKEAELSNGSNPCDECIALNGTRYPIAEAAGIITVHPRCTCAMLPVINDRVISEQLRNPPLGIAKAATKIEPVDPPEEVVLLQEYPTTRLNQGQAIELSQKMRETYPEQLNELSFGEMENAILTHNYEAHRNLAVVDDKIVGAIAFHYDETSETIYIDHIGTLTAPKGTGAELVRTVVDAASRGGVGISFESTPNAEEFWVRLGFERVGEISYVFEVDYNRVRQIKEALGSTGRVKEQTGE